MDRQLPNFNIFLNPQSNIKPSQRSNNKETNKNQQTQYNYPSYLNQNRGTRNAIHEIPESEFPTSQHPVLFYKIKERLTSEMLTSRIGYRVRQYSRVEQDYICYLTQLLMTQCTWMKIFIIEPNYLYFQISSMSIDKQSEDNSRQNERQEISLQNRIMNLLRTTSQQIFNPWLDSQLRSQKLTSQQFDEQKFIEKFQQQVVKKVKQKYDSVFVNRKYQQSKK